GNPGRIDPVDVLAGSKAVHQQDRIALTFVEIGNFNSAVVKTRHHRFHLLGDQNWRSCNDRKSSRARQSPPEPDLAPTRQPAPVVSIAAPSFGAPMLPSPARWSP